MRRVSLVLSLLCLLLAACSSPAVEDPGQQQEQALGLPAESSGEEPSKGERIPFSEGQLYAVAHLGYLKMTDYDFYREAYLDGDPPIHYFSAGDYYLVIPRYGGMALELYYNDIETSAAALVYEDGDCRPFILQCNASDIFPDATIRLTYEGESAEFSPFISLMDGSFDIGERGLLLTKED